jgi:hypothetical protein
MRPLIFALLCGLTLAYSGCVWPPDDTEVPIPYNNVQSVYLAVHRISERTIAGQESVITIISPDYADATSGTDSVQFIIVNGDTAYRHPVSALPPSYDSAAPYHIDGTANFVTFVFPSFSLRDTSYESDIIAAIIQPPYGDTLQRMSDVPFGFQTSVETSYIQSATLEVTDSLQSYNEPIETNTGTIDVPYNEMETFQPGTLWAELHLVNIVESYNSNNYYYENVRRIMLDRIVAYPLR